MAKRKCLHCAVFDLLETNPDFKRMSKEEIIIKLSEVIGDMIDDENYTHRAKLRKHWGSITLEIMDDIEKGDYK